MSGIHSKWPVLQEHPVEAGDLDGEGVVRDDRVGEWIRAAVAAYIERCPLVQELAADAGVELTQRPVALPPGSAFGRPELVLVSAGATEVHPTSFTVAVRIRSVGGDREQPINAACVVRLEDIATGEPRELGNGVRDELIALQHAARYSN